jgi:hypothetical protein
MRESIARGLVIENIKPDFKLVVKYEFVSMRCIDDEMCFKQSAINNLWQPFGSQRHIFRYGWAILCLYH